MVVRVFRMARELGGNLGKIVAGGAAKCRALRSALGTLLAAHGSRCLESSGFRQGRSLLGRVAHSLKGRLKIGRFNPHLRLLAELFEEF